MVSWSDIRAESVLLDDEAVLVLDKPAGVSVMGERHDTDLVRLAREAGEELYPVHRIDKVTSGLVLFAKDLRVHGGLTRQFNKRTVDKAYLAITAAAGLPAAGRIDLPLSVGRKSRVRIAAPRDAIRADTENARWYVREDDILDTRVYPATTRFTRLWTDDRYTVLAVRPVSGRRHQIRVHLAWIGHPIVGDPLFDRTGTSDRTSLHSWRLAFDAAWRDGERLSVAAEPGADFWTPLAGRLAGGQDPAGLLTAPCADRPLR
jgi:tRNA pseudouridine32 synthase/23S rRNA pseudouridine746 synthase